MVNGKRAIYVLAGLLIGAAGIIGVSKINSARHPAKQQAATNDLVDSSALQVDSIPVIPNRPPGQTVKVNGIDMYYEVFGDGPPLLLLHGGAAMIESWYGQIPEFSKKFKVIAVDSRGQGRTRDGEGPIDFKIMASDFEALLRHLGINNVSIVGWSDGGVAGMELAKSRPQLVKKLVALGSHSRPAGLTDQFKAEVEASSPDLFPEILVKSYKDLSPDGPEHWPVVFGKLKTMWLTLPDYKESELRSISCPVMLLVGEKDIVREEESRRMASLMPNARLNILKGATHYAPVEVPDIVNQMILEFLEE